MGEADKRTPSFPGDFDAEFAIGPEDGNQAYFGHNVLRGLIDGIDDFIQLRQPRWRQARAVGPAMLASAMWIDDPELIDKLGEAREELGVPAGLHRRPLLLLRGRRRRRRPPRTSAMDDEGQRRAPAAMAPAEHGKRERGRCG